MNELVASRSNGYASEKSLAITPTASLLPTAASVLEDPDHLEHQLNSRLPQKPYYTHSTLISVHS